MYSLTIDSSGEATVDVGSGPITDLLVVIEQLEANEVSRVQIVPTNPDLAKRGELVGRVLYECGLDVV